MFCNNVINVTYNNRPLFFCLSFQTSVLLKIQDKKWKKKKKIPEFLNTEDHEEIQRDVVLVHGNKEIYCVMDVVDSIIRYMIASTLAQEEPVAVKMQAEEKVKEKAKKESEEWVVDKSTETTKQHHCCRSDCMRNTSEKEA